ncbi:transporter substrate-binding domain-containing protein [Geodermatophilus sabuli]|uniref:Polar amino acid transport system substrate-binding protein n=1 Tax=Geodermatophilus sabuli TaxID=1564158 RepID=A0A285EJI6_9ACTN|nr:transporter substrate-binding domain-containing protein [Geodermatophilus sabuli]MBB3083750.1 polar amino acid transport system substrate-binding protein [Geodermatophilus sabuli]SNX99180.1 polar amino acid transport system substrate-binding protein [Geodermatophilus sabuli]
MTARTRRARLVPVLAAVSVLALGACSSTAEIEEQARSEQGTALAVDTGPDQDRIHTTPSRKAIDLLPDGAFPDGVLRVSITQGAVPLGFYADDNETVIGSETDIATLVADALDLELELVVNDWSNWPLATQSGEVDATISNVTVTEERKQLFDFSSYRVDQLGWLVAADSDLRIDGAADIAGRTVAVGSGTNQEQVLLAWDEENRANGLEPVRIDYYEAYNDAVLALQSGRIDTYFGPTPPPPTAPPWHRRTSRSPAPSTAGGRTRPRSPSPPPRATAWPRRSPRPSTPPSRTAPTSRCSNAGACRPRRSTAPRPTRPAWAPEPRTPEE